MIRRKPLLQILFFCSSGFWILNSAFQHYLTLAGQQTIFARIHSVRLNSFLWGFSCMSSQIEIQRPAWAIPDYLETHENHLTINGVDALALVKEYDSPLYVFSEARIRSNIERLKQAAES